MLSNPGGRAVALGNADRWAAASSAERIAPRPVLDVAEPGGVQPGVTCTGASGASDAAGNSSIVRGGGLPAGVCGLPEDRLGNGSAGASGTGTASCWCSDGGSARLSNVGRSACVDGETDCSEGKSRAGGSPEGNGGGVADLGGVIAVAKLAAPVSNI